MSLWARLRTLHSFALISKMVSTGKAAEKGLTGNRNVPAPEYGLRATPANEPCRSFRWFITWMLATFTCLLCTLLLWRMPINSFKPQHLNTLPTGVPTGRRFEPTAYSTVHGWFVQDDLATDDSIFDVVGQSFRS